MAITVCYVTFAETFTGTDAFAYRVRDNEGNVSDTKLGTFTVFEVP